MFWFCVTHMSTDRLGDFRSRPVPTFANDCPPSETLPARPPTALRKRLYIRLWYLHRYNTEFPPRLLACSKRDTLPYQTLPNGYCTSQGSPLPRVSSKAEYYLHLYCVAAAFLKLKQHFWIQDPMLIPTHVVPRALRWSPPEQVPEAPHLLIILQNGTQ